MWDVPLHSVLQPIVDADNGRVIGHEALLRGPAGSPWEYPQALFREAERRGQSAWMEYQARRLAVERLSDLPPGADLFINIDPIIPPASPPIPAPPDRVVLEISESRSILDSADLMERILAWRRAGHRIAIDDYGAGYWGLGAALALRPDIVKIDRSVLVGAVTERVRQAAVQAVLYVCETLGAMVIAEGVETADEYELLKSLGVRYMQGWLWGHAQSAPNLGPMPLPDAPDRPSALLVPPFPKSSP